MDGSSLTRSFTTQRNSNEKQYKPLLIGQYGSSKYLSKEQQEESLKELLLLADTAGLQHLYDIFFKIVYPDPKFFFTSGLLNTIKAEITEHNFNILIVDADLKPSQLRNLEEELKISVVGRVELILDIFAMRAKTKATALQVELAQLSYIMPRLKGLGGVLSRMGGGIGSRGPGETMLETDRRHIRRRIKKIKEDLEQVSKHRQNSRKNRALPLFALVGYTNAGKSTLLNTLSSSAEKVFAEDRLFATLDSASRKIYLGLDAEYKPLYSILTDTIGFIRNLPAHLVSAFHSTLEEITFSDIIVLVLDASSSQLENEIQVVEKELEHLNVPNDKRILFFNKIDLTFEEEKIRLMNLYPNALFGSAISKESIEVLRKKLYNLAIEINEKRHIYHAKETW